MPMIDKMSAAIAGKMLAVGDPPGDAQFIGQAHAAADNSGNVRLPNSIARRVRALGMTPVAGGIPVTEVDAKLVGLDREERIGIKTALARAGQIKPNS